MKYVIMVLACMYLIFNDIGIVWSVLCTYLYVYFGEKSTWIFSHL